MADVYTSAGEAVIVDLIDGTSSTHLDNTNAHVGWGTGAGTADKADTTLFTEASETRVTAATSQSAADTNQWVATLTADGAKTITNAGLFNAESAGSMIVKGDFTGIVLALGDKIEFTISLEQS
jgi:hypothetical protein